MVGELGEVGLRIVGVPLHENFADALVQTRARERAQFIAQGLAHQRVREPVAGGRRARRDQAMALAFVEAGQKIRRLDWLLVQPEHAFEQGEIECHADHRRDPQDVQTGVGEAGQAVADGLAHTERDARTDLRRGRVPAGHEEPDHLAGEEGIASGASMHRCDQPRRGRGALQQRDEVGQIGFAETVQLELLALARHVAEDARNGMVGWQLRVASGADDEQPRRPHLPRDEAQQQERRRVGPVHIVEYEDHGLMHRRAAQEGRDGIEEAEARVRRPQGGRLRQLGESLAQVGNHLRDTCGACPHDPRQRRAIAVPRIGADHFAPGPERRCPLAFPASRPEHCRAALARVAAQLIGYACLADPCFASQEPQTAAALARVVEGGAQRLELLPAPDKPLVEWMRVVDHSSCSRYGGRALIDRLPPLRDNGGHQYLTRDGASRQYPLSGFALLLAIRTAHLSM